MLHAIMVAQLCALAVMSGGTNIGSRTNKDRTVNRPEPSTLAELQWSVLYEGATLGTDVNWDPPSALTGGSANNYCQATLNSFNTMGSMSYVGSLTLSDGTFGLMCTGAAAIPNSWGIFTYGPNQFNTPFGNGYLCISPFPPGIYKMPTQHLGNGTVVRTMAAHPADFVLFTAGSSWNFQFWYRDPPAGNANFNLSDGLHITFGI